MSFFKKIGKDTKSFFKKAQQGISSTARKAELGLGEVGRVARVGSTILDNPVTVGLASATLGPEAGVALEGVGQGLGALSRVAGKAKAVARDTKELTDPSKTRERIMMPQDTLERAKRIQQGAKGVVEDDFFKPRDRSLGSFLPRGGINL
jgi:hypothetical protein